MTEAPQKYGEALKDRVAYVTGGTRGIGAAVSRYLADEGAHVALGFGGNVEKAEAFLKEMQQGYPNQRFIVQQGNINNADHCRETVQNVVKEFGQLDILVNNAGITRDHVVLKMTDQDWNDVLAVDLSGSFFLSQEALRHMIERGSGRIVNVSSAIGEMGGIGQANYASAKSGLFGLTKTLAREAAFNLAKGGKLGDDAIGITVNTVSPGYTNTEMMATVPEKVIAKINAQIPVGRMASPEEIARVVRFLCHDESSYITGQVWDVNGGLIM